MIATPKQLEDTYPFNLNCQWYNKPTLELAYNLFATKKGKRLANDYVKVLKGLNLPFENLLPRVESWLQVNFGHYFSDDSVILWEEVAIWLCPEFYIMKDQ